jgi:hypothetical protein
MNIILHPSFETRCWAAGLDPEDLSEALDRVGCVHDYRDQGDAFVHLGGAQPEDPREPYVCRHLRPRLENETIVLLKRLDFGDELLHVLWHETMHIVFHRLRMDWDVSEDEDVQGGFDSQLGTVADVIGRIAGLRPDQWKRVRRGFA